MTHLLFLLPLLVALSPAAAQDAPSYVGSAECAGCHADQADQWRGSHHGLAWTLPSGRSVVADFDGTSFTGGGVSVAFSRDETGYHATVTEGDGFLKCCTIVADRWSQASTEIHAQETACKRSTDMLAIGDQASIEAWRLR